MANCIKVSVDLSTQETLYEHDDGTAYLKKNVTIIPVNGQTNKTTLNTQKEVEEEEHEAEQSSYNDSMNTYTSPAANNHTETIHQHISTTPPTSLDQESESHRDQPESIAFDELEESKVLTFYDLSAKDINNEDVNFSDFRGKMVLIINFATQCLASYQLLQLETLYNNYKDRGFVILAFPSNDFFQERKRTNDDISMHCTRKYNVTFPLMDKIHVNGKSQHEVYKYLKGEKKGFLRTSRIKWNYEKFLINRDGVVIKRYSTLQKATTVITKDLETIFQREDHYAAYGDNDNDNDINSTI